MKTEKRKNPKELKYWNTLRTKKTTNVIKYTTCYQLNLHKENYQTNIITFTRNSSVTMNFVTSFPCFPLKICQDTQWIIICIVQLNISLQRGQHWTRHKQWLTELQPMKNDVNQKELIEHKKRRKLERKNNTMPPLNDFT